MPASAAAVGMRRGLRAKPAAAPAASHSGAAQKLVASAPNRISAAWPVEKPWPMSWATLYFSSHSDSRDHHEERAPPTEQARASPAPAFHGPGERLRRTGSERRAR